jgi:trimethylamine-N-oxide reductase cytochrome c-type subunit TorC
LCHRLHEPKDFTANQWPHQIESMMTHIPLEDVTKNLIVKYLQQNAADSK